MSERTLYDLSGGMKKLIQLYYRIFLCKWIGNNVDELLEESIKAYNNVNQDISMMLGKTAKDNKEYYRLDLRIRDISHGLDEVHCTIEKYVREERLEEQLKLQEIIRGVANNMISLDSELIRVKDIGGEINRYPNRADA